MADFRLQILDFRFTKLQFVISNLIFAIVIAIAIAIVTDFLFYEFYILIRKSF